MKSRLSIFLLVAVLLTSGPVAAAAQIPLPPQGHPRLYLTAEDIPALRDRMNSPEGRAIIERMESLAVPLSPQEDIPVEERGFRYYFQMRGLTSSAQLQALDYLVNGNAESARKAVVSVLDSLRRTDYGKEKDLSRANGVMLMVGAIVYDWCYDTMSAQERCEYVGEFTRIASRMECGWPISVVERLAGHTCEWMIMRDLLSAGIAIYDEYPQMYTDVMRVITEEFVPVREFCYAAGNYHQGSKYLPTRYSSELFAQWIVSRMNGGRGVFSDAQKSLLFDVIYRMRPDGTVLPSGDENPTRMPREENFALPAMLASSYWGDGHLRWLYERNTEVVAHSLLFQLLWNDDSLTAAAPDDLPLTRFCPSPFGWMIARTGWDENCVIAEMKVNEQFVGNHQHLDGGSFQIWHKGSLAIDSGIYEGTAGGYNSEHCRNYSKRTIAHNSLLVYNPEERFEYYKARPHKNRPARCAENDGGQRMPGPKGWDTAGSLEEMLSEEYTVGRTLSQYADGDFSYLKGDITPAYSNKVVNVERSFVFCNLHDEKMPAALVVFDRIVAADPSFRKVFLLHSIEQPSLGKDGFFIRRSGSDGENGLLRTTVLLPKTVELTATGGRGHEFDVFGTNWPNSVEGDPGVECGAWRVEESPRGQNAEDHFLNIIQISDSRNYRAHRVRRVDAGIFTGADFNGRMVMFSVKDGLVGGEFSFKARGRREVLICDVDAGEYEISRYGRPVEHTRVAEGENIMRFSSRWGRYTITKVEDK